MDRRHVLEGTAALVAAALAGCTGGSSGGVTSTTQTTAAQTTTTQATADETVEMKNTSFDPEKVNVDVGGTVEWVNEDAYQHDVTSAAFSDAATSWEFEETLDKGDSTAHTFDAKGVYEYYCSIHGKDTMCGVVLVGDVSYDGSLPCEGGGGYSY